MRQILFVLILGGISILPTQAQDSYAVILIGENQRPEYLQRLVNMLAKSLIEDCNRHISNSAGIYRTNGNVLEGIKQSEEEAKIIANLFKNPHDKTTLENLKKKYKSRIPKRLAIIEISLPPRDIELEARINLLHYNETNEKIEIEFQGKGIPFLKTELTTDEAVLTKIKNELSSFCQSSAPVNKNELIRKLVELEIINPNDPEIIKQLLRLRQTGNDYVLYLTEKAKQYSALIYKILSGENPNQNDKKQASEYFDRLDRVFNEMVNHPNIGNKEEIKKNQEEFRILHAELKK